MLVIGIPMIIVIAMASTLDGCFMSMPRDYHKVHPKLIWVLPSAYLMLVVSEILAKSAPALAALLWLMGLLVYFVIRGIAYLGLDATFRAFSRESGVRMPVMGTVLALAASTLDVLGVVAAFIYVFERGVEGNPITLSETAGFERLILVVLSAGLFISAAFLMAMVSNKTQVAAHDHFERKEKMNALLQERKRKKAGPTPSV